MANTEQTQDRELVLTRTISAPRERVWQAWTRPEHIVHWWGPDGFTNTIHEMDVRPGGVWRYMIHEPDGTDYPNIVRYTEIREPEFLAYEHGDEIDGKEKIAFNVTVNFDMADDKTLLTMRLIFPTAEALEEVVKKSGAVDGGNQTLNHLEEYLHSMS